MVSQSPRAWTSAVNLPRGSQIARKQLHNRWGGVRQGGIAPSTDTPNVFLFTDEKASSAHGYRQDRWVDSQLFEYCGEGQTGDQSIVRYNKSVATAAGDGKEIHLFSGWRGIVTYVGPIELDEREPFYFDVGRDVKGNDRRVVVFRLRPSGFRGPGGPREEGLDREQLIDMTSLEGSVYRYANESATTNRERVPFSVDPDLQDRSLRAHAIAQNVLAEWVADKSLVPLSPSLDDPPYDLAWRDGDSTYVAEVKSIVPENEVRQLRLGLGQVLDYAHQLDARGVLFVDRRPLSDRWSDIAAAAGVELLWPASLVGK